MSLFGGGSKPGGAFSFGTPAKSSATTGVAQPFGSTTSAPAFSFGAATTAKTTASGLGGFGSLQTTTATTTTASGFGGFGGLQTTTATTSASGLKLGGGLFSSTTTAGNTLGGGSLGFGATSTATTTTTAGGIFTSQAQQSKPVFKGLGGTNVASLSGNQTDNGTNANVTNQALKDQQLPSELCKDVHSFEQYMERQKKESGEIGKFSVQSLHKIREDITLLSSLLGTVGAALQRNTAAVQKLRSEFGGELNNIQIAQRTKDTPPALQHDNIAPTKYFMHIVAEFESNVQIYRQQIEQLENHLRMIDQPNTLTIKDISIALCKIQESFVSIGANLYSVHNDVQTLKEHYLQYRRIVFGSTSDVFSSNKNKPGIKPPTQMQSGPSPFGPLGNMAALAIASAVNQQQPPQQGLMTSGLNQTSSLFGAKPAGAGLFGSTSLNTGFGGFGSLGTSKPTTGFGASTSGGLFGAGTSFNSNAGVMFGGAAAQPFQLQKPPPGSKRNKK